MTETAKKVKTATKRRKSRKVVKDVVFDISEISTAINQIQIKDKKVISFVKRRRKSSSKSKKGHRQQITLLKITDILETGADKTNIQEAKSGKGLKIDYSAKVNISNKAEKVIESVKAKPAKKTPVKKEPKVHKETKAVKTASVAANKKKKDTTKKSTAVKKKAKKKLT